MTVNQRTLSLGFLYGATFILVLDAIHILLVHKIEVGVLDFLPSNGIMTVFISYPVLLLGALLLVIGRQEKLNLHEKILFMFNLAALMVTLYYLFF